MLNFRCAISSPSTEDSVALVLRNGCKNARSSRISVEPLDDAALLVIIWVQADMAVAQRVGDDDRRLLRIEIALARLARAEVAGDGRAMSARCLDVNHQEDGNMV